MPPGMKFLGSVPSKISEHQISNQIDFIKKTDFYKLLSSTSKEITTDQLCSVRRQNKTTFFNSSNCAIS